MLVLSQRSAPTAEPDPTAALVARARTGDRPALSELLRTVAPGMLGAIRAVLGSADAEVEDVLQDSFVALAAALTGFRGESSLAHFARRIAVNQALMLRRRRRVQRRAVDRLDLDRGGQESVAKGAAAERRRIALRALLDQLPAEQAEALVLFFVLRYSLEEIAEATGAPRNTVRSRLRLGRERLRDLVAADETLYAALEETP